MQQMTQRSAGYVGQFAVDLQQECSVFLMVPLGDKAR